MRSMATASIRWIGRRAASSDTLQVARRALGVTSVREAQRKSWVVLWSLRSRTNLSRGSLASLILLELLSPASLAALTNAEPRHSQASHDEDTSHRPHERVGPRRPLLVRPPRTGRVVRCPHRGVRGIVSGRSAGPRTARRCTVSRAVSLMLCGRRGPGYSERHARAQQDAEDTLCFPTQRGQDLAHSFDTG